MPATSMRRGWSTKRSPRRAGPVVRSGCAQHEAPHQLGVPVPQDLGHRTAHRVPDDDHGPGAQHAEQGGDVVGGVRQPEPARLDPAAVAAQVGRQDAVGHAQRLEGGEPVQVRGGGEAVEEDQAGGVGSGAGVVADEDLPTTRQRHEPALREGRPAVGSEGLRRRHGCRRYRLSPSAPGERRRREPDRHAGAQRRRRPS